ncbi:lipase family alpha/beta hydrolase [Streptomyces sp. SBT349]|uniref:lipase family alpha/beta hydrolase n=1 Tax=Streptomyces sp. SBT349 TaxID=1580539 RepID=UPI00066A1BEE|nr:alpha/beta hydrolase [Streptomyces sp. SBT349]
MKHDLVVFVPGIMGSRLTRDGKDAWALSLGALLQFRRPARAWRSLALPPGIGDGEPEGPAALRPEGLLTAPAVLPGLLSHLGYRDLGAALALEPGQFRAFAYDWRLSNRVTAARLKVAVEAALEEWRPRAAARWPGADEARVVLVCHSMGGLVARYYLERLGGHETARALVTIGTPHQGAAKAIRILTGNALSRGPGQRAVRGWVGERLAELCGTFPSVAQLLPVYRAALRPRGGRRVTLENVPVPDLPGGAVRDAFAFSREFTEARDARPPGGRGEEYRVYSLGGGGHPTVHGVRVTPTGLEFPAALDDSGSWSGDGTVPEESSLAYWALDGMDDGIWSGHRHAALAGEDTVVRQLTHIIGERSARKLLAGDGEFGVEVPEFAVAGEPFEVVAVGVEERRRVRVVVGAGLETWEEGLVMVPDGAGNLRAELRVPAGTHVVEVRADGPEVRYRDVLLVGEESAE